MFLARKISRAKWGEKHGVTAECIAADAVTVDLRTGGNTLSFWQCGAASEGDINDVALALAAGSERLDKIDLVWISEDQLRDDGHVLCSNDGLTPLRDMVERHVDVQGLNYGRLGKIAMRVSAALADGRWRRVTKESVRAFLVDAIEAERVQRESLHLKLRNGLGERANRAGPRADLL